MSKLFSETNGESAFELFNKRTVYRNYISKNSNTSNVVHMDVHEKILYGRITQNFKPIRVNNSSLKKVTNTADRNIPLQAINFVADVFDEMCTQFEKCAQTGKIKTDDPFLSQLKAYKGYQDPFVEFKKYQQIYFNSLAGFIESERIQISSFGQMIKALMPYLKQTLISQPITFTGFLKSRNCSVMSTGLAIEIAEADYINDSEKVRTFLTSPNWNFFVNTCNSYGFIVDANVPWRIVADIGSPEFIEYAQRYSGNVNSVTDILDVFFSNCSRKNYNFFKNSLLTLYNTVAVPYTETKECADGTISSKVITPEAITVDGLNVLYPESYFIELFTKLRLFEEMPQMPEHDIKRIVARQISKYKTNQNLNYLHNFLESEINKTFDKSNSLSYNINGRQKRRDEQFSSGQITNITITEGGNDFSGY